MWVSRGYSSQPPPAPNSLGRVPPVELSLARFARFVQDNTFSQFTSSEQAHLKKKTMPTKKNLLVDASKASTKQTSVVSTEKEATKVVASYDDLDLSVAEELELKKLPAAIHHFVVTRISGYLKAIAYNSSNQRLKQWFDISNFIADDIEEALERKRKKGSDLILDASAYVYYTKASGYPAITRA